jgi:spore germination protein YaaH
MKWTIPLALGALFLATIGVVIWWHAPLITPLMPDRPQPSPSLPPLAVFASIPHWDQERAAASFREHVDKIDYISLFWYTLAPDGAVVPFAQVDEDVSLISFAHQHDVKVFALVANLSDGQEENWDAEVVKSVIADPNVRQRHIANLVQLAVANNFDGINIDYEQLKQSQRRNFTTFIAERGIQQKPMVLRHRIGVP